MAVTLLPDAAALAAGAPTVAALWRREIVATLRLALPLVFAQLGMIAINTTDILMLGWLGPQELAAGALGMHLYVPIFLFGLVIASVVPPMVSQALGARDFRGVRRPARQGLRPTPVFGPLFTRTIWTGRHLLSATGLVPQPAALAGAP